MLHHAARQRARRGEVEPIYTANDAVAALRAFRAVPMDRWQDPLPGVRARWWNAGHMLGSGSIELEIAEEGGAAVRVLVSGDLGPDCTAFHRDPDGPQALHHVFLESTYGDEDKPCVGHEERRERLAGLVRDAAHPAGALLIPAFAVERTQEICWDLVTLMQSGRIPQAPIFVDSPLAIRATEVFCDHAQDLENGRSVKRALRSPLLHFTESGEQSRRIAEMEGFHIIVAGSGMCDAGRIRHHLKRWLWSPEATVLLTCASRATPSASPPRSGRSATIRAMPTRPSSPPGCARARRWPGVCSWCMARRRRWKHWRGAWRPRGWPRRAR